MRRSIFTASCSEGMRIFTVLSMLRVSAVFLRVPGSLAVAAETLRRQECHDSPSAIMPTIKVRKQANGITRYTAIVRIRRGGAILHRESRTFAHRSAALSWAKYREVVLEDPSALTRVQHGAPTLAELIRWYIDTFETIS